MAGEGVRPPKVEIRPNSSVIWWLQTTWPSLPSRQRKVHCAARAGEGVNPAVHDDGAGHAAAIVGPDEVFALRIFSRGRGPVAGEIFLAGDAVLFGAAPAIPVVGIGGVMGGGLMVVAVIGVR